MKNMFFILPILFISLAVQGAEVQEQACPVTALSTATEASSCLTKISGLPLHYLRATVPHFSEIERDEFLSSDEERTVRIQAARKVIEIATNLKQHNVKTVRRRRGHGKTEVAFQVLGDLDVSSSLVKAQEVLRELGVEEQVQEVDTMINIS